MFALPYLPLGLPTFSVIQPYFPICTYADEVCAVGAERHPIYKVAVLSSEACVEFKGSTVVEYNACIIAPRRRTQRSLLPYGNTVDLRAVTGDLAHGVAAIGRETVPEAFFAITDRYDPLRVPIPSQVVDAAANDMVLALCGAFSHAVPNSYGP